MRDSDFRFQISDFRFQISNFRFQIGIWNLKFGIKKKTPQYFAKISTIKQRYIIYADCDTHIFPACCRFNHAFH
jgi:hypothetical protein